MLISPKMPFLFVVFIVTVMSGLNVNLNNYFKTVVEDRCTPELNVPTVNTDLGFPGCLEFWGCLEVRGCVYKIWWRDRQEICFKKVSWVFKQYFDI